MNENTLIIPTGKYLARVIEDECIGCTLCIKACPFDAIIGASKYMHTVIKQDCTGCKLCLPPCPVDCIVLDNNTEFELASKTLSKQQQSELKKSFALYSRENKRRRELRQQKAQAEKQARFEQKKQALLKDKS